MSKDVFVKFDRHGTDVLAAWVVRGRSALGQNPAVGGAMAATVLVVAALWWQGPPWARLVAEWLVAILAVERALSAGLALPYAMFRRGDAPTRPTPQEWQDWAARKMSVDASAEGIVVTHGARSSSVKWSDCRALVTGARAHVVYFGERGHLVVPRRAFRTPEKDEDFQTLAREHIPQGGAEVSA